MKDRIMMKSAESKMMEAFTFVVGFIFMILTFHDSVHFVLVWAGQGHS